MLRGTEGEVLVGGDIDYTENYLAPTIVVNVKKDDALMQDEVSKTLPSPLSQRCQSGLNKFNFF